ncbi:phosphoenolpyruvate synthase [Candidatus Pacearchaeota archaeon]|nr:phosphoenolpyruvate synthase [Candidatus Pacearchaeota archaeon]
MKKEEQRTDLVKWFSELSNKDIAIGGGKGASLSEMYNNKFPIPPGFIITAQAYSYFIDKAGLKIKIEEVLKDVDKEDTKALEEVSKKIKQLIVSSEIPVDLAEAITESYDVLDVDKRGIENAHGSALAILKRSHEPPFVAVRSSATTEDLADASFAGQQDSFLNVKGNSELIQKVKKCFASLFNARAIYYRMTKGFSQTGAQLAVVVQRMVDSEKSGVMFSKNPTKNDGSVVIEAVWGLGEGIVSGMIKPDHYQLSEKDGEFDIKDAQVSEKKIAILRDSSGENKVMKLTPTKSMHRVLLDKELKSLARYALKLEEHYGKPQDIEFAITGEEIFIVQSRPITTKFQERKSDIKLGKELLSGLGASPGVSSGVVRIVHSLEDLDKVKKGDVLVTEMTNPDMVVSMARAAAIVTDEGGVTSHAAIVSREMGIPCVVGTGKATSTLHEGQEITVDGSAGKVHEGKGEEHLIEVRPIVPTKTKIKVIVDLPLAAERAALSKAQGIGLCRLEGIIAASGKHPFYYVQKKDMEPYYNTLLKGLENISRHFHETWIRTSDLRSDEFNQLEGAPNEIEGNPMLGDHGVRFGVKHLDIMETEVKAILDLARKHSDKVFGIMVPQVISVEELQLTKKIARANGLPSNVKIGIMVETPAAVQIIHDLCEEGLDFISFGTNDLTQYTLAIDRNNASVQHLFNEMNPAVLSSIKYVIRKCKKYGVETSICGQAGSKEEMAKFLVGEGIDSISVNADAAEKVSKIVAEIESRANTHNEEYVESGKIKKNSVSDPELSEDQKPVSRGGIIPVPAITAAPLLLEQKDIEEVILEELDGKTEQEYEPGESDPKKDIPALNDAIPVNSEMLNNK